MGCCLSRQSVSSSHGDIDDDFAVGKNRPLSHSPSRWRSEFPLTEGQLRSKRDEFWDTAPAFEGRKEIWDAIRAAAGLAEQTDFALAQAILDGAGVSLPNGTLRECYDELGSRYQLIVFPVPIYCLSKPINLVSNCCPPEPPVSPSPSSETQVLSTKAKKSSASGMKRPSSSQTIKLRISFTDNDIRMHVHKEDTVASIKERLHKAATCAPEPNMQRWFFGGRYLTDRSTIAQCHIPHGFVVQVVSSTCGQPSPVVPRPPNEDPNNNPTDDAENAPMNPGEVPSTSTTLIPLSNTRKHKKRTRKQRDASRRKPHNNNSTTAV